MPTTLVWFKRDLRVEDHAPLLHAARRGEVLCLHVEEPSMWAQPDAALQHHRFMQECLADLEAQLAGLGLELVRARGEVVDVLAQLHAAQPFDALYAHEETGNGLSFERDVAVGRWCRSLGVQWKEWAQQGVVRRLPSRNEWAQRWQAHMHAAQMPALSSAAVQGMALSPQARFALNTAAPPLALAGEDPPQRQRGGRARALQVLHSFLHERSRQYRGGISSPLLAPSACSRLSPYLAWGCLSMREVVQATEQRLLALDDSPEPCAAWQRKGLSAFVSRLHWHCHFIQKLESQPDLEFRNLHRSYEGLREGDWNDAHFQALVQGRTGWPMVDACVAMLKHTGWVNFRMRAMLVSVASYPLWLHWRPVGLWLAQQFLDYEPGIHWSQMQMQAGTTGINTTRVYNPIKQAHDHDPQGRFVRRWLPALRRVPDAWIFEPWRMPTSVQQAHGLRVGEDIAAPLVDLEAATRQAKARVHALRAQPEVRAGKAAIVEKHASRAGRHDGAGHGHPQGQGRAKPSASAKKPRARAAPATAPSTSQLSLDF
jgi:deoxyribodipyrimidine photo-lyase